jgi:hypothetical protein
MLNLDDDNDDDDDDGGEFGDFNALHFCLN